MLVVTAVLGVASIIAVYFSARVAMGFGRDVRERDLPQGRDVLARSRSTTFGPASLITRNTNDVQQVQTVVFMALTVMVSAPILIVGGIIMALRTDVPLSGLLVVDPAAHGRSSSALVMSRRDPAVPGDAGQARPDQPGHARDAGRRPRHPRLRPDRARGGALRDASLDLFDTSSSGSTGCSR